MAKTFNYWDLVLGLIKNTTRGLFNTFVTNITNVGYADYQDTTADVALVDNVWTDVPNNQEGIFTITKYLPRNIKSVMDPITGYLDFSELRLGDQIFIRNDFTITPTGSNAFIEARYLLGSNGAEFSLGIFSIQLSGVAVPFPSPKGEMKIVMSFDSTLLAPGKLQVRVSGGGTLNNEGSNVTILSTPQLV